MNNTTGDVLREIRLDDANRLVLREENKRSMAVVEIVFGKRVVQSYEVANALVEKASIDAVHLAAGRGETQYLVRIPDRSSTFGAEKGIIVYRLQWWEFLLVPDDRERRMSDLVPIDRHWLGVPLRRAPRDGSAHRSPEE